MQGICPFKRACDQNPLPRAKHIGQVKSNLFVFGDLFPFQVHKSVNGSICKFDSQIPVKDENGPKLPEVPPQTAIDRCINT